MAKNNAQKVQKAQITQEVQEEHKDNHPENLPEDFSEVNKQIKEALKGIDLKEKAQPLTDLAKEQRKALEDAERNAVKQLKSYFNYLKDHSATVGDIETALKNNPDTNNRAKRLELPRLIATIEADPDYKDITIADIINSKCEPDGYPKNGAYREIIERAEQRLKEDKISSLPALKEMSPGFYAMVITPAMDAITGKIPKDNITNTEDGMILDLPIFKKGQTEISDYVYIGTNDFLSRTERNISNAIFTICMDATEKNTIACCTVKSIYRNIPGASGEPSKMQADFIEQTMEKFSTMRYAHECNKDFSVNGKDFKIVSTKDTYIITKELVIRDRGGHDVKVWVIKEEPIELQHARETGQIATVKRKYLDIKKIETDKSGKLTEKPVNMNDNRRAMAAYMAERIAKMKNDNEKAKIKRRKDIARNGKKEEFKEKPLKEYRQLKSNVILFETIFAECGIKHANRTTENRDKSFCIDTLEYWKKAEPPFIADYKIIKGKSTTKTTGIEIILG